LQAEPGENLCPDYVDEKRQVKTTEKGTIWVERSQIENREKPRGYGGKTSTITVTK
jgi:hypothetical protein